MTNGTISIFEVREDGILIEAERGEIFFIRLYMYDLNGEPIDLTGFKVYFYIFDSFGKNDEEAVITKRNVEAGGSIEEITVDNEDGYAYVTILADDTKNLNGNQFYYSIKLESGSNPIELLYAYKFQPLLFVDDSIYEYEGWSIDKSKIAYYSLKDESLFAQIPDFICENAVTNMCSELNKYKENACAIVDKNDKTLNLAIEYYAVCEMRTAGITTQSSGTVIRESIGDKTVQYGNINQSNISKVKMPQDVCEKAVWLVKQFTIEKKWANKDIQIAIKNYRSGLFNKTYNKYTDNYTYGEP